MSTPAAAAGPRVDPSGLIPRLRWKRPWNSLPRAAPSLESSDSGICFFRGQATRPCAAARSRKSADLARAFHTLNERTEDKTKVFFFDEFDAPLDGMPLEGGAGPWPARVGV
jgi:hypothetical protein